MNGVHVVVEANSLLPLCGPRGLNSGQQAWQWLPLPAELTCQPLFVPYPHKWDLPNFIQVCIIFFSWIRVCLEHKEHFKPVILFSPIIFVLLWRSCTSAPFSVLESFEISTVFSTTDPACLPVYLVFVSSTFISLSLYSEFKETSHACPPCAHSVFLRGHVSSLSLTIWIWMLLSTSFLASFLYPT